MNCPYCEQAVNTGADKCVGCGFPLEGGPEEKTVFFKTKRLILKNEVDTAASHLRKGRYIIFGIAAFTGLAALVSHFYGEAYENAFIAQIVLTAIFFALGVVFHKAPITVSIIALLLTVPTFNVSVLSGIIIVAIGTTLYFAIEDSKAKKRLARLDGLAGILGVDMKE